MDNLKLDAIGIHKCTLFQIVTNLFDPTSTAVQG